MTVEEIRDRVADIRRRGVVEHDDESAHGFEDGLYEDLLRHIALHAPEPFCSLAAEALKSQAIDFSRWCA